MCTSVHKRNVVFAETAQLEKHLKGSFTTVASSREKWISLCKITVENPVCSRVWNSMWCRQTLSELVLNPEQQRFKMLLLWCCRGVVTFFSLPLTTNWRPLHPRVQCALPTHSTGSACFRIQVRVVEEQKCTLLLQTSRQLHCEVFFRQRLALLVFELQSVLIGPSEPTDWVYVKNVWWCHKSACSEDSEKVKTTAIEAWAAKCLTSYHIYTTKTFSE